jgi:P-type E1-E2 ATPase
LLHFKLVDDAIRSRKEVLGYLANMEAPASHPLSDAIVKGAEQADTLKLYVQNHTLLPGEGITAVVEGKNVHVGNKRLFDRLNLYDNLSRSMKATTDDWSQSGGTVGFISIEGEGIVGSYCVADKIRHEAKEVVTTLKCMGIDITMITGDQRGAALNIGAQIGLECPV